MNKEYLNHLKDYYNNQKGQKYPCSNQIVKCAVITRNREKAIKYMYEHCAVMIKNTYNRIEWLKDYNEEWVWMPWTESSRGYRFYKIIIDEDFDDKIFNKLISPRLANYCCHIEIM